MTPSQRAKERVVKAAIREFKLWAPVYYSEKHANQHIEAVLALHDACAALSRKRRK